MATTFINGTGQDVQGSTYLGNSVVKLGYTAPGPTAASTNTTTVFGEDLPYGVTNLTGNPNPGFVSDRAPNQPSGYLANGEAEYGDGKLNTNTTFNPDYGYASPNAKFTYAKPNGT